MEFCYFVGWCISPVHYWSDGVLGFI